jgi:hypothetical protein
VTVYLHEVHRIVGEHEDDFEAAYRDPGGWMDLLGRGEDARLLYYLNHAHGSGPSYRVVTITAVDDGRAWERLAARTRSGDLAGWARAADHLRYDVVSKVLLPVSWSPLGDIDLATVAAVPADHEPTLFMEDTGWPDVAVDDYVEFWGRDYYPMLARQPEAGRLLEIQACFVPAFGTGRRPEAMLWQRIHSLERLVQLFTVEVPPQMKAAGTYMAQALTYRDQWESRLLRTSTWSPRW